MKNLGLNEIREKYLAFFEGKGHLRMPSFPLVPLNDASLLLINAGMAPLKPYFTGKETPPRLRVTTCQKCIRTPDIERVGKTARHGTFFEMLGNFSFGDYFKKEAIAWAWEFVTQVMEMPKDKLWVTVYLDDDEAFELWRDQEGVPEERIVRMGKEDNFWEIGTGPCGPCSEIYFDRGEKYGCGSPDCKIGCDCDRFVEFWNLVFTQFDKDESGSYNRLAHPNIDTGMGLERLAAIMQDVGNLFEVDTIRNIMREITRAAGTAYGENEQTDISLRVITDHIRSTTFMISDNISPSNEGRGYVLRRLLRRAARHGKLLGINKPFLYEIADTVINESCGAYPELKEKREYIKKIIKTEEKRFDETIDTGLSILNDYIAEMKNDGKDCLSGENAFKLYDTYGFPIDLTVEILEENSMTVDRNGFEEEMQRQRQRARSARANTENEGWSEDIFSTLPKELTTKFSGYDRLVGEGTILSLIVDDAIVAQAHDGQNAAILMDETVFYGESGGQAGDRGELVGQGFRADVFDCKKLADGKIIHFAHIIEGTVHTGDKASQSVDKNLRKAVQRNHSATHLLHKALKEVLGSHVAQAGSYVTSERLRFDFSHYEALSYEQVREVEGRVNAAILEALPVTKTEMPQAQAKALGAAAQFGEKYGETVRVVDMGGYSLELCGGCHVNNTSEIALCTLLSEQSAAAGVRRIEAVTGEHVLRQLESLTTLIRRTSEIMKVNPMELDAKARSFMEHIRNVEKAGAALRARLASGELEHMLANVKTVNGIKTVCAAFDGFSPDELRAMGDKIKDKLDCGFIVLASTAEDKITFIAMATKSAVERGVHAGNILKKVSAIAGGGGGGKPEIAQAGGKIPEKVDDALAIVDDILCQL